MMISEAKTECGKVNCQVKGFWYETIAGEVYYCHKAEAHGKKHVIKTKVREIAEKLKEAN